MRNLSVAVRALSLAGLIPVAVSTAPAQTRDAEIEALRELVSRPRSSAAALSQSERVALRGEVDRFIQSLDEIREKLKS